MHRLYGNSNFWSISPNEFIASNTLVWVESTEEVFDGYKFNVDGPFILVDDWKPGSTTNNEHKTRWRQKLLCTATGRLLFVTQESFLSQTYYILKKGQHV